MRKRQWQLAFTAIMFMWSSTAHCIVDMKSSNYSETWTDFASGPMKVERTYNSRSIFDGMMGYGWCSDFETRVEVVLSGVLKVTECGGGMETNYVARGYDTQSVVDRQIQAIMIEVKKRRSDFSEQYLVELTQDLKANEYLRSEFNKRMGIRYAPRVDYTYYSPDSATKIVFDGWQYVRTGSGGTEIFDMLGRLVFKEIGNDGSIRIRYENNRIASVNHSSGSYLLFAYDDDTGKVKSITDSLGKTSDYQFRGRDLVESRDSEGQRYKFTYDVDHNLLRVDYPDGTWKGLSYNTEKDWVTSFRNLKGCVESYDYKMDVDNPKNHFTSTVKKVCNGEVTNNSTYEFINKIRADRMGVYLQTVTSNINGSLTRINYDTAGRPIYVERDGSIKRTYWDPLGRTVELDKDDTIQISAYSSKCSGPTSRLRSSKDQSSWTLYQYDPSCRLTFASRANVDLRVSYDNRGSISKIADNHGNLVTVSYGGNNKPATVKLEGVGSITVQYKPNNEIEKVNSESGSDVAVRIASLFNDFLDIANSGDDQ